MPGRVLTDRRQQIIDAAFHVFSRKGFTGATNRDIASQAKIAPGLIYWYFRTKEDLLQATAEAKSPLFPLIRLTDEMLDAPPRQFFHRVASLFLERVYGDPQITAAARFLFAEAMRYRPIRKLFRERIIVRGLDAIARYIRVQIDRGTIRPIHPMVGARLFMGMLMSQILLGRLLELGLPVTPERLAVDLVETYLEGVLAKE
ncbi:MAG TPA: TetR/AcrR family transcriptional regulator [bacterium]|jgi:AcrR family transcriptional regulator|nr:TetR/AcrR family transcriptional regulator [bacterium]